MSLNDANGNSPAETTVEVAVGKRRRLEGEEEPVSILSMCEGCQLVDIQPP
jgi:hypothetical protein